MANRAIEIHDSVLAEIGLCCWHRVVQKAVLRIDNLEVPGIFSRFLVDLGGDCTRLGEDLLENSMPLPLRYEGDFELRLVAMWQSQKVVC